MTAIVAWAKPPLLASDRCESSDNIRHQGALPKIAKHRELLIGAAGESGACNFLVHTPLPKRSKSISERQYIISRLARHWRTSASKEGVDLNDVSVIIVGKTGIWTADGPSFGFSLVDGEYWAIGSGAECALGALYNNAAITDPRERLLAAVKTASVFVPSVSEQVDVEVLVT